MEDLELHRDELFQKLQYVKKQRDEFLEKGKIVEEERNEFVRSNKTLEQYLYDWKRKTAEFKKTNQALKDKVCCTNLSVSRILSDSSFSSGVGNTNDFSFISFILDQPT